MNGGSTWLGRLNPGVSGLSDQLLPGSRAHVADSGSVGLKGNRARSAESAAAKTIQVEAIASKCSDAPLGADLKEMSFYLAVKVVVMGLDWW